MGINNLPNQFIGKGEVKDSIFTKIKESDKAFLYEVDCGCTNKHYEVFRKKFKTNSVRYCYPTSKAFGIWGWCFTSQEKAEEKFEWLSKRII